MVGHFNPKVELGRGAYGVVHKGIVRRQNGELQEVAVKQLLQEYSENDVQSLVKEMDLALDHPGIV